MCDLQAEGNGIANAALSQLSYIPNSIIIAPASIFSKPSKGIKGHQGEGK
jgi:hypothetical protein